MSLSLQADDRRSTPLDVLLRRAAIPAMAHTVVDLENRSAVATKIVTGHPGEPMDAVTIARTLNTIAAEHGRPATPVIFEVPIGTLLNVTAAGLHSDHPLIVSLDADEMLDHPAESLRLVERARELGWEIGLHHVGRAPAGLTAVTVFEPSLITIAPEVLRDPASPLAAEMLQTVTAFRHATGATVMAEQLDSAALRHTAASLGATLGLGRAVPVAGTALPSDLDYTLDLFVSPRLSTLSRSPFELSVRRHQSQRAHPDLLDSISRKIERAALGSGRSTILVSCFEQARMIDDDVARRYTELRSRTELIMLAAPGLRTAPVPGACWTDLPRHDDLRGEWITLLLAPTSSMMLAARQVRRTPRGEEREYDYVLSYDRDLVAHAARSLLTRLTRRARH